MLFGTTRKLLVSSLGVAVFCGGFCLIGQDQAAAQDKNPFPILKGYWKGTGTLEPIGGEKEVLKCRVIYRVADGGGTVKQVIDCSGTDYRIRAKSDLKVSATGVVSGQFSEEKYEVTGEVAGKATTDTVAVDLVGAEAFAGRLMIRVKGPKHHDVTFSQEDGNKYYPIASIVLRR